MLAVLRRRTVREWNNTKVFRERNEKENERIPERDIENALSG